jgi:hypothetical protein
MKMSFRHRENRKNDSWIQLVELSGRGNETWWVENNFRSGCAIEV